jgi:hypothetical protein
MGGGRRGREEGGEGSEMGEGLWDTMWSIWGYGPVLTPAALAGIAPVLRTTCRACPLSPGPWALGSGVWGRGGHAVALGLGSPSHRQAAAAAGGPRATQDPQKQAIRGAFRSLETQKDGTC